jgi:hypothetical protein
MYAKGRGVSQNPSEAVKWYRLAADQGYADSRNNLGVMYEHGRGVPQSLSEAVEWYRLAADQGNAAAQNNLALMYEEGRGVPKNDNEAFKWYRLAAEQGHAQAQNNLGFMYSNGRGVSQNNPEAVKWYRLAADQGFDRAQYNLGVMYAEGKGVPQNVVMASEWYVLAAGQGFADAQNNLGAQFIDILHDRIGAYALFSLAQASGHELAANNLRKQESQMSRQDIERAQALALQMNRPGQLAIVLSAYLNKTNAERTKGTNTAPRPNEHVAGAGTFPARPLQRPGVTSCNTNCTNGNCYRTYDDGRKVRFQARQKFDHFTNQLIWDSGTC